MHIWSRPGHRDTRTLHCAVAQPHEHREWQVLSDLFMFLPVVVLLFTFFSVWCCLLSPALGSGACLLSSVGWCCLVSPFLLGGVAVFPFPLGGVAFHRFLWVGLLFHPSSVGWCCFVSSFLLGPFGCCCCFYFSCLVVLSSSSFGWCCLVSSSFFGWCYCFFFSFSCLVALPSFSSLGNCCLSPLLCWAVLRFPSLFGGVLLDLILLWVVLLFSLLPFGWSCFFPCLLLGGAAWSPPLFFSVMLLFFLLPFGGVAFLRLLWVRQRSPSLLFGGAAWFPPPLGGVAFVLSFYVVLPSFRPLLDGLYDSSWTVWRQWREYAQPMISSTIWVSSSCSGIRAEDLLGGKCLAWLSERSKWDSVALMSAGTFNQRLPVHSGWCMRGDVLLMRKFTRDGLWDSRWNRLTSMTGGKLTIVHSLSLSAHVFFIAFLCPAWTCIDHVLHFVEWVQFFSVWHLCNSCGLASSVVSRKRTSASHKLLTW